MRSFFYGKCTRFPRTTHTNYLGKFIGGRIVSLTTYIILDIIITTLLRHPRAIKTSQIVKSNLMRELILIAILELIQLRLKKN